MDRSASIAGKHELAEHQQRQPPAGRRQPRVRGHHAQPLEHEAEAQTEEHAEKRRTRDEVGGALGEARQAKVTQMMPVTRPAPTTAAAVIPAAAWPTATALLAFIDCTGNSVR